MEPKSEIPDEVPRLRRRSGRLHNELPEAREVVIQLAQEFKSKSVEAQRILEQFHIQYASLVVDPTTQPELARKNGLEVARGISRLEENHKPIFDNTNLRTAGLFTQRHQTSADFGILLEPENAVINVSHLIKAFQICDDNQWKIPFNQSVLIDALTALKQYDAELVFLASLAIKAQLNRYNSAVRAELLIEKTDAGTISETFTVSETTNDARDEWLREQKKNSSLTITQIRIKMSHEHVEWEQLKNDSSVNRAIQRYEERKGLSSLPKRKRKN